MRVLFADDSPTIRAAVADVLHEAGHEVTLVVDGVEAVESFFADPPDLVLLDLYMPRLTGWVACRLIKDDPLGDRIPVLVITGMDGSEDRFWAEESGADAFLKKDQIGTGLVAKIHALSASRALSELSGQAGLPQPHEPPDVLARVCDVLDRKLFDATVVNEITAIGIREMEPEAATVQMLDSLRRLVAYDVGAFVTVSGMAVTVQLARRIPQQGFDAFATIVMRHFNQLADAALSIEDLAVSVVGSGEVDDGSGEIEWQSVHMQPLVAKGKLIGLVCLAAAAPGIFEGTAHRTLRTAGPALASVVDGSVRSAALAC